MSASPYPTCTCSGIPILIAAQASQELAPGAVMLKKNSPSGGGLHPIEAYLLVQRVEHIVGLL